MQFAFQIRNLFLLVSVLIVSNRRTMLLAINKRWDSKLFDPFLWYQLITILFSVNIGDYPRLDPSS